MVTVHCYSNNRAFSLFIALELENVNHIICLTLVAVLTFLLAACDYFVARKVPTLGLASNSDQCPKKKSTYFYRRAGVAMCLPEVMVAYTHCVTELTLAGAKSTSSSLTAVEAANIVDKITGIKLKKQQRSELEDRFENEGFIGEARAKAINACTAITEAAYKKKPGGPSLAPTINAAAKPVEGEADDPPAPPSP